MAAVMRSRAFEEITIGNCVCQEGHVRYQDPWEELESDRLRNPFDEEPGLVTENTGDDDDDDTPQLTFCDGGPPIAPWRSNLVALSQRFNVYFAAFQAQIHMTIPRNVKLTLPGKSDMIIMPARSAEARRAGGYLLPEHPHCINHMIVGNLGIYEILLLACDDGDVLAWYTHLLVQDYEKYKAEGDLNGLTPISSVSPFFHENVGKSAWGLAIHEESRLIAVASNLRQVTVFAFALDTHVESANDLDDGKAALAAETFPLFDSFTSHDRDRNFRILLSLGRLGHNIPSVAFTSKDGEAESIVAIDIHGNTWVLGIWSPNTDITRQCLLPVDGRLSHMGWGVLIIPLNQFKKVPNLQLALGSNHTEKDLFRDACSRASKAIDTSHTIEAVRKASSWHSDYGPMVERTPPDTPSDGASAGEGPNEDVEMSAKDLECLHTMQRVVSKLLPDDCAIFRTYKHDIELRPPIKSSQVPSMVPTVCKAVASQPFPPTLNLPFLEIERLNMLVNIPELSLVIVASQAGRAVLITLTQVCSAPMFRVERIVPFKVQEDHGLRPDVPLLGMAVSPLPIDMPGSKKRGWGVKRWRLILHYYDHTILSYELSRDKEAKGLVVS